MSRLSILSKRYCALRLILVCHAVAACHSQIVWGNIPKLQFWVRMRGHVFLPDFEDGDRGDRASSQAGQRTTEKCATLRLIPRVTGMCVMAHSLDY